MSELKFDEVIDVLSRKSGRAILNSILEEPKTVKEVHQELKKNGIDMKYRESVYKALERLVSVGLVEKLNQDKSVRYKSHYSKVLADFLAEDLDIEEVK